MVKKKNGSSSESWLTKYEFLIIVLAVVATAMFLTPRERTIPKLQTPQVSPIPEAVAESKSTYEYDTEGTQGKVKTFTDPDKTISFEYPSDYEPETGNVMTRDGGWYFGNGTSSYFQLYIEKTPDSKAGFNVYTSKKDTFKAGENSWTVYESGDEQGMGYCYETARKGMNYHICNFQVDYPPTELSQPHMMKVLSSFRFL